jgi:hypothetical protein
MPDNNPVARGGGYSIPYSTYWSQIDSWMNGGGSEGGGPSGLGAMSEEDWNKLTPQQQFETLRHGQTGGGDTFALDASDNDISAFKDKYGDSTWGNKSGLDGKGRFVTGYGDLPTAYDANFNEYAIDPSRVLHLPDGRWVIETDNIQGDWLAHERKQQDRAFNRGVWQSIIKIGAMAAGASALSAAGSAADAGYISAGEGDTAAVNAGLTSSPAPAVGTTGTPYIPAGEGDAAAVNAGLTTNTPVPTPTTGTPSYIPAGEGDAAAVNSGLTSTPTPTPATGTPTPPPTPSAGAPSTPVPPAEVPPTPAGTPAGTPAANSGIIQNGNPNLFTRGMDWANSLSPTTRMILGLGISQGIGAIAQSRAQRAAQEQQDHQQEQANQDRVRRGSLPAFGNAFTPRTSGIINSRRGG